MANIRDIRTFPDGMLFTVSSGGHSKSDHSGRLIDLSPEDVAEIVFEWFNSASIGPDDYLKLGHRMRHFMHMDVQDIIEGIAEGTGQKWERKA